MLMDWSLVSNAIKPNWSSFKFDFTTIEEDCMLPAEFLADGPSLTLIIYSSELSVLYCFLFGSKKENDTGGIG